MDVDAEIDALYAGPVDEFVAGRNELVKRLRAAKQRDEAARVAALRRPTVVAWALNQLARSAPDDVERLLAAGSELQQAQRRLLSGIRDDRLREASRRRRDLIERLAARAAEGMATAGHVAVKAELEGTLEAATVDAEVAETLRAGRLTRDVAPPSGFGDLAGLAVAEVPEPAAPKPATAERDPALQEAEAALQRAQQADAAAAEQAAATQSRAEMARREAEAARERAQRLLAEAQIAHRLVERADARAEREEAAAREAAQEQQRSAQRLQDARKQVDRLRQGR